MNYSIVIATRNRLKALELSIPRMISQSCPPTQLIVVDSSDDHAAVSQSVRNMLGDRPIKLIIQSSERGLTIQRNRGLEYVNQPLVFFPDDDSIWFPKFAEEILSVYRQDVTSLIAAVGGAESRTPPDDFPRKKVGYKMSAGDRLKGKLLKAKLRIEKRFFPDPVRLLGKSFIESTRTPPWLESANVVPVETMTGFRMTFRTEAIQLHKFDTNLKRYSPFEDRDASFSVWREGAVVAARRAKVFHYRSPERRDNGRQIGVTQLLNLAYVIAKHTQIGHPSRNSLQRYCRYKSFLYSLSVLNSFGRERFGGAIAALSELPSLLSAPPETAAVPYQKAMERCLGRD